MPIVDTIDGWTKEENADEHELLEHAWQPAFWIYTKGEVDALTAFCERWKRELLDNTNRLRLQIVGNHVWASEYSLAMQENTILQLLEYDHEVPCV